MFRGCLEDVLEMFDEKYVWNILRIFGTYLV
jgi:hypothetical protein